MEAAISQPKSKFQAFITAFPFLHVAIVCVFSAGMSYATVMITQNFQLEKIDRLEKLSTSRELFDERTKAILDRLEKQESKIDRILEKK